MTLLNKRARASQTPTGMVKSTKTSQLNQRRLFAWAAMLPVLLLSVLVFSNGVWAKDIPGATQTSYAVSPSGAFSFQIPIVVPQGVNGVQPNLSLSFSSSRGNGRVGVGWDLTGLSAIARCGQTLETDGVRKGASYRISDRYCLDGKPLILVSGSYGQPGSEYRTEIDEFSRIEALGSSANLDGTLAPLTFKVSRKDGSVWEYGIASSAIRLKSPYQNTIHCWKVYKVSDRHGNAYRVSYRSSDGQPDTIEYNAVGGASGNKLIDFVYQTRTDQRTRYLGGTPFVYSTRLARIDVKQASVTVRQYKLAYRESPVTKLSQLISVIECGLANECVAPISIQWQADTGGFVTSNAAADKAPEPLIEHITYIKHLGGGATYPGTIKEINRGTWADVNGDGKQDLVIAYTNQNGSDVRKTYLKTATGWDGSNAAWKLPKTLRNYSNAITNMSSGLFPSSVVNKGQLVDVNGDGLIDVVYSYKFNKHIAQYTTPGFDMDIEELQRTYINTGSGWQESPQYKPKEVIYDYMGGIYSAGEIVRGRFVDINRDGLVDWISSFRFRQSASKSRSQTWLNTGSGWALSSAYAPPSGSYLHEYYGTHNWGRAELVDVNGDGLLDWLEAYDTYWDGFVSNVWLNTGTSFVTGDASFKLTEPIVKNNGQSNFGVKMGSFVDVNGDGLRDWVRSYWAFGGASKLTRLNTGRGWVVSSAYAPPFVQTDYKYIGHQGADGNVSTGGSNWPVNTRGFYIDLNQDGLVDFSQSYKDVFGQDQVQTWINDGTTWVENNAHNPGKLYFDYSGKDNPKISFGGFSDINNDGSPDWLDLRVNAVATKLNRTGRADQLDHITTTMGITVDPTFLPLTANATLYKKVPEDNGVAVPEVDDKSFYISRPIYVTASLTTPTPIGTNGTTSYQYEGAQVSRTRGFLGFKRFYASNSLTGITRFTEFNQGFPFIGQPLNSASVRDGVQLSTSLVTPKHTQKTWPNGSKTYFPYVEKTGSTQRELQQNGGAAYRTTLVEFAYDGYGNVTEQTTKVSNGLGQLMHTTSLLNTFNAPDLTNWFIGQVTNVVQTNTTQGKQPVTNESSFSYHATLGYLNSTTREPNSTEAGVKLVTNYAYDGFGNVLSETTTSPTDIPSVTAVTRSDTVGYDGDNRLPNSLTNALGQQSTLVYHPQCDQPSQVTDENGLVTTFTYDNLCRQLEATSPSGIKSIITYNASPSCGAECQSTPKFQVTTQTDGEPSVTTYFNAFNQAMLTTTTGFAGQTIKQRNDYDYLGRLAAQSQPYFDNDTVYWSNYEYDILGRATRTELPYTGSDNLRAEMSYGYGVNAQGYLQRSATDVEKRITTSRVNALGQVIEVEDAHNEVMHYAYDSRGSLVQTTDAVGNQIHLGYDKLGRRTTLNDPDLGVSSYTFSGFGELLSQTDAKTNVIRMSYDSLSRLTQRAIYEDTASNGETAANRELSTWAYDNALLENGTSFGGVKGAITQVTGPNGYAQAFQYDAFSRPIGERTTIKGSTFNERYAYNADGYLSQRYYPSSGLNAQGQENPFGVTYEYQNGYLKSIFSTEDPSGMCIEHWQADNYDALGRVDNETVGSLVATTRQYKGGQNVLERIQSVTVKGTVQVLQDLNYTYDGVNNLSTRSDAVLNTSESFSYDNLDRLLSHTKGSNTTTVSYDAVGNITYKSDVGNYHYPGAAIGDRASGSKRGGPHALSSVTGSVATGTDLTQFTVNWDYDGTTVIKGLPSIHNQDFEYDANGNVTKSGDREFAWTAFDKPERMIATVDASGKQSGSVFEYGPEQQRVFKQELTLDSLNMPIAFNASTIYLGKYYERITDEAGQVTHRYTIETGGSSIQVDRLDNSARDITKYLLVDNLGSTNVIVNTLGQIEQTLAFDPWGMRLNTGDNSGVNSVTNRGYTGHEMDDETGLINMNARIYDPYLGRFLSADPVLPDAGDMQQFNRYSYVGNNPMKYIDPTGNSGCGIAFRNVCGGDGNPINVPSSSGSGGGGFTIQGCLSNVCISSGGSAAGLGAFATYPNGLSYAEQTAFTYLTSIATFVAGVESGSLDAIAGLQVSENFSISPGAFASLFGSGGGGGDGGGESPTAIPTATEAGIGTVRVSGIATGLGQGLATVGLNTGIDAARTTSLGPLVNHFFPFGVSTNQVFGSSGDHHEQFGRDITAPVAILATGGRSLIRSIGSLGRSFLRSAPKGVSVASDIGRSASMRHVRNIRPGEKIDDLINEAKGLTFTTGNEHALVKLADGTRAFVSGGPGGINFAPGQITRIFGHTHPTNALPSAADAAALRALGQSKQYVLHGGQISIVRPK